MLGYISNLFPIIFEWDQWETKVPFSSGTRCSPKCQGLTFDAIILSQSVDVMLPRMPTPLAPVRWHPTVLRETWRSELSLFLAEQRLASWDGHCIPGEVSHSLASPTLIDTHCSQVQISGRACALAVCLVVPVMGGGMFSIPHLEEVFGGGEVCCLSDKILLFAVVTSILEDRVTLQGHVGALSKLRALCLIGVIGALVPEQVLEHDEQKTEQDEGHSDDHNCNNDDVRHGGKGRPCIRHWRVGMGCPWVGRWCIAMGYPWVSMNYCGE